MASSSQEPQSCSWSGDPEAGRSNIADSAIEVAYTFPGRRRSSKTSCMVANCPTSLSTKYELRYRLCTTHMKAPQFLIGGELHRWCQKCGKFHPLVEFDGARKSCRAALERHNDKQKKLRLRKLAAAAAGAAAAPSHPKRLRRGSAGSMGDCIPVEIPLPSDSGMASEASASPPPLPPSAFYTVEVAEVPTYPGAMGRLSPLAADTPFGGPWGDALAAAFPPVPSAQLGDEVMPPQELDDFIAEMLLEPSVTLEGLDGRSMDPAAAFLDVAALPPVLDLPLLV